MHVFEICVFAVCESRLSLILIYVSCILQGNDNVIECVTQDGMIDIYQSYNTGDKHNERLTQVS